MNEYLSAKNGQLKTIEDIDSADTPDVVAVLRKLYVEVRKTDGLLYALKSFSSIRYGLQRHFLETRKEDIVHDKSYDEANTMFKAMLVHLKKEGKGTVTHKHPISREDMQKLYSHEDFSLNSPDSLQKRVFFEYVYYFCNRGRENIRDVQKDDFELKGDSKGLRYVRVRKGLRYVMIKKGLRYARVKKGLRYVRFKKGLRYVRVKKGRRYVRVKVKRQTKNHRGDDLTDHDNKDGRMFEIPGNTNANLV